MRHHSTGIKALFRVAALSAMLSLLVPLVMPVCAMVGGTHPATDEPCHEVDPVEIPCHEGTSAGSAASEVECCTVTVASSHEDALLQERVDVPEVLLLLVAVVTDDDGERGHVSILSEAPAPPVGGVILPILYRSLLN